MYIGQTQTVLNSKNTFVAVHFKDNQQCQRNYSCACVTLLMHMGLENLLKKCHPFAPGHSPITIHSVQEAVRNGVSQLIVVTNIELIAVYFNFKFVIVF